MNKDIALIYESYRQHKTVSTKTAKKSKKQGKSLSKAMVNSEDNEESEDNGHICPDCNGSGEGRYDGSHCRKCGGSGDDTQPWGKKKSDKRKYERDERE
jgi:RecJ-like exonuclease